jgi:hypothetical protein
MPFRMTGNPKKTLNSTGLNSDASTTEGARLAARQGTIALLVAIGTGLAVWALGGMAVWIVIFG